MKKTRILFTLTATLLALNLSAQTASTWVTNGLNRLVAKDLVGAYSDFNQAVSLSPTNPDANVLAGLTRILALPVQPAGSNFCNRLGISAAGRNLYDWTARFATNASGDTVLPPNLVSTEAIAFFTTNVMPAIAASLNNLASITDTNYTLTLTASQTSVTNVTLDYGDLMLLEAFLHAANFVGHTANADNFSVVINYLHTLGQANNLTAQAVLGAYPELLTLTSAGQRALSKADFTNAIACYFAASDFIRGRSANDVDRLFDLPAGEQAEEASFRDAAIKALASLSQPVVVSTNSHDSSVQSVYAGAYFSGTKSLRNLMPQFQGNSYVNDSLPDYTFGGILLGEPVCDTEALLRKKLHPAFAGVYDGSALSFDRTQSGGFILFVGGNNQAALLGQMSEPLGGNQGLFALFTVAQDGKWSFNADGCSASGQVNQDGTMEGTLFTPADSFSLQGHLPPVSTPFQNVGYYSGTWKGGGKSGSIYSIFDADGAFGYGVLNTANGLTDGGVDRMLPGSLGFTNLSTTGTRVTGQFKNTTPPSFTGTFSNAISSGTYTMTRTGVVNPDTAPTLQAPLPPQVLVTEGQNATFTVHAVGSAPLCYQWYSNNVVLGGAITSSLVVQHVQPQTSGTVYSVLVRNVVGSDSSSTTVTAVGETNAPTLKITSPYAGQNWLGNAQFTVTGTATDNVQVASVWCQVNSNGWQEAAGTTDWAAAVPLVAGVNTLRAYAVDTSGNYSRTNSVSFTYVVTAPLVVNIGGSGKGTVSPNYNGQWLQIGANYALKASASAGCVFTNWTGSLTTNAPTLQFTMAPNLTFTANFIDVQAPTLVIASPSAGQRWLGSAQFAVKGTAADNVQVARVWCQVNSNGWVLASGTTNWTAAVALSSGANTVRAYAEDASGHSSRTNSVSLTYVVSAPLVVNIGGSGKGTVSPNYNGQWLQIGANYAMTASAGAGCVFTNWTGSLTTNAATLHFTMASNLTFTANFVEVTRPTVTITSPISGAQPTNGTLTASGTASDKVHVAGVYWNLNNSGWNLASTINHWTNWTAGLTLNPGPNTLAVYAADDAGNRSLTNFAAFFCLTNLVQTYWPMHDGDWKTFSGLITPVDMSFATNNQLNGSFVQQVILGEAGETNLNYYQYGIGTNTQVLLSEENVAGDDMLFSPFIAEQDRTQLLKDGTRQISTTLSLPDGQFPATAVIKVASIGNAVTVPAGTFPYCKNVNITITVSVPGIGNIPLSESAYVLAPGVGQIQISYYQASNSGFDLLGTDTMTAGVINGVNVTNLTEAALAP